MQAIIGAVLGKRINKVFHTINYVSKVFNKSQIDYTIIENKLLAMVYAGGIFRSYLMGAKVVFHMDHSASK